MPEFFRDKTPGPGRKDHLLHTGAAGPEIRNSTLLSVTMTPDPGKPITGPFFFKRKIRYLPWRLL